MHKLVVIGDSLSQGFQSGAISRTRMSYPAMLARAMGLSADAFRVPDFSGVGGLPLNLERVMRHLADHYGETIGLREFPLAMTSLREVLDVTEDYWEREDGTRPSNSGPLHHNLAVWGFEVQDADRVTQASCREHTPPAADHWFKQLPEHPMYRTAERTLNPSLEREHERLSQVAVADRLASEAGGIENLVFWLGANNCLGTVARLDANKESQARDLDRLPHERDATLWHPEHFEAAYRRVARRVDAVGAKFVFVGTVPRVTIPPISRGVSLNDPERDADGYYEYYTRFWTWDDDFKRKPSAFHKLTRAEARRIDTYIDRYNDTIRRWAASRPNWHVIDLAATLDALAFRRQAGQPRYRFPDGLVDAIETHPKLKYLVDRSKTPRLRLDTRYLCCQSGTQPITAGGIFSLDGVHPTTIGYGVVASEMLTAMNAAWTAAGLPEVTLDRAWWEAVVDADELLKDPPKNLNALRELLGFLGSRGPLRDLAQAIGGDFLR